MINSENSIQINPKFIFTVYEYIIVYEPMLNIYYRNYTHDFPWFHIHIVFSS